MKLAKKEKDEEKKAVLQEQKLLKQRRKKEEEEDKRRLERLKDPANVTVEDKDRTDVKAAGKEKFATNDTKLSWRR